MKSLFCLILLSLTSFANAEVATFSSNSTWIDTSTVLISNGQMAENAKRDCESIVQVLNLMTSDKIVFRSSCTVTNNPRCIFRFCYELKPKVLVVEE